MGLFGSSRGDSKGSPHEHRDRNKSWTTKTQRDSNGNKEYMPFPQQNSKVIEGPHTNQHTWYDPNTQEMGQAGHRAERTRDKNK